MVDKKSRIIVLLAMFLLVFTACGHRGPLNLPEESVYFKGVVYERP
tara:strand:- start:267 stop:404 length:138 start_codon:yes stop_codon:yes gene_type:complete